jgi:hypothetical protein
MTRLMTAFLLMLMIFPAFLLPTASNADDCIFSVSSCYQTLPATQITTTTATLNGKLTQIIKMQFTGQNEAPSYPWVFEYGIKPGVYPYSVNAMIDSVTSDVTYGEGYIITKMCVTFKTTVQNLEPCENYYVRLNEANGLVASSPCDIVCDPNTVKFTTAGCTTGFIGQGGSAPGTAGTSPSSLPVSAPVQMASVVVQSATIATTKVSPGQDVDISASVINKGTANGDAKLTLYVNGEAVESKGVTVASGQTAPVHFNVSRNEPGTYDVYVNGTPAGSFTVDMFANNDSLIYIIMALFVTGIAGTVYLMTRKKAA